jgi:hypothetical protein
MIVFLSRSDDVLWSEIYKLGGLVTSALGFAAGAVVYSAAKATGQEYIVKSV